MNRWSYVRQPILGRLVSRWSLWRLALLCCPALFWVSPASATSTFTGVGGTGGATLPWNQALNSIAASLTGPAALAIAVIALAVTGCVLVFGGELTDFAKRACYVVMAIAFLVGGTAFLNTLFGFSGCVI